MLLMALQTKKKKALGPRMILAMMSPIVLPSDKPRTVIVNIHGMLTSHPLLRRGLQGLLYSVLAEFDCQLVSE